MGSRLPSPLLLDELESFLHLLGAMPPQEKFRNELHVRFAVFSLERQEIEIATLFGGRLVHLTQKTIVNFDDIVFLPVFGLARNAIARI